MAWAWQRVVMAQPRRVFVPQALGADEYLRATWHADKHVVVFSHWQGDQCTAAMPVRVNELGDLTSLLVGALSAEMQAAPAAWAPPLPRSCVRGAGPITSIPA